MNKIIAISIVLASLTTLGIGQTTLKLDNERSNMSVEGTSSLHDWVIIVRECSGATFLTKDATKVSNISSLSFRAVVKSMDSGKSGMDKNTYNAMNAEKYPFIDFKLIEVESIKPSVDGKGYIIRAKGDLTISGKTIRESLKVYSFVASDNSVHFKGELDFPMTKYGVEPPTALMGTITTGDDVKIKFNAIYN